MSRKKIASSLFVMLGTIALLVCAISFLSGQSHAAMNGMRGNNLMMPAVNRFLTNWGAHYSRGILKDAKMAFAKLKKNASPQARSASNSMRAEIDNLGKALDSGELQSAQEAYLKMQEKMKRLRNGIRSTP